jgi:hypothetical protein
VAALAGELVASGELLELATTGASLADVAEQLWPRLSKVVPEVAALAASPAA